VLSLPVGAQHFKLCPTTGLPLIAVCDVCRSLDDLRALHIYAVQGQHVQVVSNLQARLASVCRDVVAELGSAEEAAAGLRRRSIATFLLVMFSLD
jgi:hypothetical protein